MTGAAPTCPPIPPVAPPPTTTDQPGWWRGRVFYEAFVRSFSDADGDGVGDLAGLTAKLDYLNDGDPSTTSDLGVTGLWLMPTFPSPSYHGYDVTDYTGVNPGYGTLDDLHGLVAAAHDRGIAVLLDLPLNHTSAQHPWFVGSRTGDGPYRDWYVWADKPLGNGWQQDVDGRYYYAAFGADLPDLNLENPAVTAEVTQDAEVWLGDVGVDGFRLDAAKYLIEDGTETQNTPETHEWWKAFRVKVETKKPGALLLGEVYDTPQNSSSYVPDDLDLTFDFASASTMVTAAQSGDGSSVQRALARITTLYPASGGYGAFLTNHDQDRIASQLGGDVAKLKVAADLLLLGPGVPFVYYGEEIGMSGAKPDERIRTPMRWDATQPAAGFSTHAPWEALSDDPATVNVTAESADPASLWSRYRDLVRLRSAHPALATGTWTGITSDVPAVVAALRVSPTETVVTLTNVGADPASPSLSLESGPLCGTPTAEAVLGATAATAPAITAAGGFTAWKPVDSIPGRSSIVVVLGRGG
ncbi:MAG TPA: alpha-amylase family glycosyl hydrolase [Candidatus Limnocylindrales bacterium]|nr:alpha-amylase family glycosyl hydrolase [Candidatus Limnocylindrales bacterium]